MQSSNKENIAADCYNSPYPDTFQPDVVEEIKSDPVTTISLP
jgi:hypothetical protein